MQKNRIDNHPVLGKLENNEVITFTFDGKKYEGRKGDTIASALLANGVRKLRVHEETKAPRGIYCNIGHCFECRVTVNDVSGIRACLTEIKQDMVVDSGKPLPTPLKKTSEDEVLPRTYAEYTEKQQSKEDGQGV